MSASAAIDAPSPNFDARSQAVDMLILHYTGMRTGDAALARMRDPDAKVSAHYMIEEDGRVFRLVAERDRAWHAGRAYWGGVTDINSRSIGIELVNPGHEWGYRAFPAPQMESLAALAAAVMRRHGIPARHVLGHSDVAPLRKEDPGELFDWAGFAARGIGLWPAPALEDVPPGPPLDGAAQAQFLTDLAAFGYQPGEDAADKIIDAFHRHFRPRALGHRADRHSARIAAALAAR